MKENGEGPGGGWENYQIVMQLWPQVKEKGKVVLVDRVSMQSKKGLERTLENPWAKSVIGESIVSQKQVCLSSVPLSSFSSIPQIKSSSKISESSSCVPWEITLTEPKRYILMAATIYHFYSTESLFFTGLRNSIFMVTVGLLSNRKLKRGKLVW